jgi:epoxyqueuosine reductase
MNIKTAIVPFSCFEDIRQDIACFSQRDDLNDYQKLIISEWYVLKPELDFEPKSVISAAVPFDIWNAAFTWKGTRYVSLIDKVTTVESVLEFLSAGTPYHFFYDYLLPQKRIAVRNGLADYGRNNICFVKGYGSLITLFTFISDMPAPEHYTWREVTMMPECDTCVLCQKNCPTGAILPNRFLLENDKCLAAVNEWGTKPFPDFIPKTAHHRMLNCSRCQDICPQNAGLFKNVINTIEFSEEETELLLSGANYEDLPAELAGKIELCDMKGYYSSLPRNLKAWFENPESR